MRGRRMKRSLEHWGRKLAGALLPLLGACSVWHEPVWPSLKRPAPTVRVAMNENAGSASRLDVPSALFRSPEDRLIREQEVCIAAPNWSSGTLGDVILYRYQRFGDELHVGYFVYWTNERPWGENALTYMVVPALAIDLAYSHLAFVLPGLREAIHGAGDVEGAFVIYDVDTNGKLTPKRGFADDGLHREVQLSQRDLKMQNGGTALLTDVWSHQLGGRGAAQYATRSAANLRCFSGDGLEPLTAEVASAFRLGSPTNPRRARPAWRIAPARAR
jgi:hypothetical protein